MDTQEVSGQQMMEFDESFSKNPKKDASSPEFSGVHDDYITETKKQRT